MSTPTVHRRTVHSAAVPLGPGLGLLRLELDGDSLTLRRGRGGGQDGDGPLEATIHRSASRRPLWAR